MLLLDASHRFWLSLLVHNAPSIEPTVELRRAASTSHAASLGKPTLVKTRRNGTTACYGTLARSRTFW